MLQDVSRATLVEYPLHVQHCTYIFRLREMKCLLSVTKLVNIWTTQHFYFFFCPREAASSFPNAGRSPFSKDNDENGWPRSRHISQLYPIAVVRWLSCVRLFETPWTAARQASLSFTISQSLCKFTFIESSNHLILCCPLFLLPSIFPSIGWALGLSQWAGSSHQMAKVLKHQHQSFQWISRVDFL